MRVRPDGGGSMGTRLVPLVFLLLALAFVGCGTDEGAATSTTGATSGGSTTTIADGGTSSGALVLPGLYEQDDGTVQALGILTYRDVEGGFWAVVETTLPEEADGAAVVAVIGPSADMEQSVESYRGEYVSVIGVKEDVSTYQAGPFVRATSIEIVEEMTVE